MINEQIRVLEEKTMPGVRIHDQLCVGQKLRHRERVDRWYHHIVAAVRDKNRLLDFGQAVVSRISFAPGDERLQLCLDALLRNRGIRLSDARLQPPPIGFACRPALFRRREEKKELLLKTEHRPAGDGTDVGSARDVFSPHLVRFPRE